MINWLKSLIKKKKKPSGFLDDYQFNELRKKKQDRVDRILDKVSKKGIDSLTEKEKEILKEFK